MIKLLTNTESQVRQAVTEGIAWCNEFRAATAFLTDGGYYMLSEDILRLVSRGGKIRIIVGLENAFTDYNAILEFATLVGDCRCKMFKSSLENQETSFHPKIYIFSRSHEKRAILGSSNLTRGGMTTNIEANMYFDESRFNTSVVKQIDSFFDWLWIRPNAMAVEDNDAFLEEYRKATQRSKERIRKTAKQLHNEPLGDEVASRESDRPIQHDPNEATSDIRFAYLIGLICGKGTIDYKARSVSFRLENHLTNDGKIKGTNIELDVFESHRYAVAVLRELIASTVGSFKENIKFYSEEWTSRSQITTQIKLQFLKSSKLFSVISELFNNERDNSKFTIPNAILNSGMDIRRSFLRGYADLASLISLGARSFGSGKHRIYINVYHQNRPLFDGLMHLFSSINVAAHPHDRHKTQSHDSREWQIRVYPED